LFSSNIFRCHETYYYSVPVVIGTTLILDLRKAMKLSCKAIRC